MPHAISRAARLKGINCPGDSVFAQVSIAESSTQPITPSSTASFQPHERMAAAAFSSGTEALRELNMFSRNGGRVAAPKRLRRSRQETERL